MTVDDIDVNFFPPERMPVAEARDWVRIAAAALANVQGCVTMVLDAVDEGWLLRAFLWYEPGTPAFRSAIPAKSGPLRVQVVDALRLEGKPIVTQ